MYNSWWIEDIFAQKIMQRALRWLVGGVLCGLLWHHDSVQALFIPLFQYFVVAAFGNELITYVIDKNLLSHQRSEWIRFAYNLLIYNHLLAVAHSSHAFLAMALFLPLLHQAPFVGSGRGLAFIMTSLLGSYWIAMGFLAQTSGQPTAHFENMATCLFAAVSMHGLRKVMELERARNLILRAKLMSKESDENGKNQRVDDKAA